MEPMSDPASTAPTRPGHATFAGWLIIVGSVILVATAWQRVSSLYTLEVQDELRRMLSEPPMADTGLSLSALSTTVRVLCMVGAAAATATAILGFHALRRSTSARIALTCLAPVVLVGGIATAGFFAPFVVAGIVMLWVPPTRDWYAGRPWRPAAAPGDRSRQAAGGSRPDPFAAPPSPQQAGQQADRSGPPAWPTPYGVPHHATTPQPTDRRPSSVTWACILTWVVCAGMAGVMVMVSLAFVVAREELFAEFERQQPGFDYQGLTHDQIVVGVYALTAFVVVWCALAIGFAVVAFKGANWGRVVLLVSTIGAGMLCLVSSLANPVLLLVVVVTAVTTWLLLRPDASAWYRHVSRQP
jgi:hypothetical protein